MHGGRIFALKITACDLKVRDFLAEKDMRGDGRICCARSPTNCQPTSYGDNRADDDEIQSSNACG
jgi:hypothetical protein